MVVNSEHRRSDAWQYNSDLTMKLNVVDWLFQNFSPLMLSFIEVGLLHEVVSWAHIGHQSYQIFD